MGRPDIHSLTGGAGILAMLAWLMAHPVGLGLPGVDAPSVVVAAFATDQQSALAPFAVLIAIGATLLIAFVVGLHELHRGFYSLRSPRGLRFWARPRSALR